MFSGSADTICVSRDDELGEFEFVQLSWDLLRKIDNTFRNSRRDETKADPIGSISTILESIKSQAE